jgi:hypothetical protein
MMAKPMKQTMTPTQWLIEGVTLSTAHNQRIATPT